MVMIEKLQRELEEKEALLLQARMNLGPEVRPHRFDFLLLLVQFLLFNILPAR